MEKTHDSVLKMWSDYLSTIGETPETTEKNFEAWYFCDNEKDANMLADLVLAGTKRATTSLHKLYEIDDDELPKVGELSIVTNFNGTARMVTMITSIEVVPFNEVTEEFAAIEGEGDGSLRYWREEHIRVFNRDAERYGIEFHEDMLVVLEKFDVVYS